MINRVFVNKLENQLRSREEGLGGISFTSARNYSQIIILGLGGIGSHVADVLGSVRTCSYDGGYTIPIIMFDDDVVEISNLNRTCYDLGDIKKSKVYCMNEKILSRNPNCHVIPINRKFSEETLKDESLKEICWEFINYSCISRTLFIDCRDDNYNDYDLINTLSENKTVYDVTRPAYDGNSVTIDLYPEERHVHGQRGYTNVQSHSFTSRLAALLAVIFSSRRTRYDSDILEHLKKHPVTFNIDTFLSASIIASMIDEKLWDNGLSQSTSLLSKLLDFIGED